MHQQLTDTWTATTDRAESSYGRPVYVATECEHGTDAAHSLEEALQCGLLQDLLADRDLTQQDLAQIIGTYQVTISRWVNGHRRPMGLYREKLENWILKGDQQC